MGKKKSPKKANDTTQNLGFEVKMFNAADKPLPKRLSCELRVLDAGKMVAEAT